MVGHARGDKDSEKRKKKLPTRSVRVVPIGGPGLYQIVATLERRGWTQGEVVACRQFVHHIHFANREIVDQHRQQIRARHDAKDAALAAEPNTKKEQNYA